MLSFMKLGTILDPSTGASHPSFLKERVRNSMRFDPVIMSIQMKKMEPSSLNKSTLRQKGSRLLVRA